MASFSARIRIIGVNPYLLVPQRVLRPLFERAKRTKGPLPVKGRLNGQPFTQTIVKHAGLWRLYLNTSMRKAAGIDVGDLAHVEVEYDPASRALPMNPHLGAALAHDDGARAAFERLPPSRQQEILRYLASLKSDATVLRNVEKVRLRLLGKKTRGLAALMRQRR